jgi:hypothetical protein
VDAITPVHQAQLITFSQVEPETCRLTDQC